MEHYSDKMTFKDKVNDVKTKAALKWDKTCKWASDNQQFVQGLATVTITGLFTIGAAAVNKSSTNLETKRVYDPVNRVYVVPKRKLTYAELVSLERRGNKSVAEALKEMKLVK